jgi:hypothetical protein
MSHILGQHVMDDVEAWKRTMEEHREWHRSAGLHLEQVWQREDDPRHIYFLFRVDEVERAREMLTQAGALDAERQRRGEIPELVFLESR